MIASLLALFKIQPHEITKVVQFACFGMLMQAGLSIGMTAGDALFLTYVGSERLPVIFILTPVVMLIYTSIFSYLLLRFDIDRTVDITLLVLIVGGISFWAGIHFVERLPESWQAIIFYAAKLYAALWYIALYSLFWNFTESYFDLQDAKRLFAFMSAGTAFGAVSGGLLVNQLSSLISLDQFYLLWALIAALTIPVVKWLQRTWSKLDDDSVVDQQHEPSPTSFVTQLRNVIQIIAKTRYVLLLTVMFFTELLASNLIEYNYFTIFSQQYSEEQLAALFGILYAVVNIFNIIVNLFFFNRLVLLVGVRNAALIVPITYLIVYSYFFIDYSFGAALLGFWAYQGMLVVIDYNNQNFLINAIDAKHRKQIRTFIEGLAEPFASCFVGLFLLLAVPWLNSAKISFIGLVIASFLIFLIFLLRRHYREAMITNLKKDWLDFTKPSDQILAHLDQYELDTLKQRIHHAPSDQALTALQIYWLNDPQQTADLLLEFLKKTNRQGLAAASTLLRKTLNKKNSELIARLLKHIDHQFIMQSPELIEELGHYRLLRPNHVKQLIHSHDPYERAVASVVLWNSWNPRDGLIAMQIINGLLDGNIAEQRSAIRALGYSGQERYAGLAAQYLNHAESSIRTEALTAICRLVTVESTHITTTVLRVIRNSCQQNRLIAIEILNKIADTDSIVPLLAMGDIFTPFEKRQIEEFLVNIGLRSIPAIVTIFQTVGYSFSARSIAARALARLSFAQFDVLFLGIIETELQRTYEHLHRSHLLQTYLPSQGAGCWVLSRIYDGLHYTGIEFVLELLTLSGRLPDFELLASSLRSDDSRIRANAIETLEQGTPRKVFKYLLPLVDGRADAEKLGFYHHYFKPSSFDFANMMLQDLDNPLPLASIAAAQTLWESSYHNIAHILRAKLQWIHNPAFQETVSILLGIDPVRMTLVEKIYHLAHSQLFEEAFLPELVSIASQSREYVFPERTLLYSKGDRNEDMYCLIQGTITLQDAERMDVFHQGMVGFASLFNHAQANHAYIDEQSRCLIVSRTAILDAAQTYPRLALQLFKVRVTSHKLI
jgi:hypothetical protein